MSIETPTMTTMVADLRLLTSLEWRKATPGELFDEYGLDFSDHPEVELCDHDDLGEDRLAIRYTEMLREITFYVVELWRFDVGSEGDNLVRTYRIRPSEEIT